MELLFGSNYSDKVNVRATRNVNSICTDDGCKVPVQYTLYNIQLPSIYLSFDCYLKTLKMAVNGLFAKTKIEKNEIFSMYAGRLIDSEEGLCT